MRAARQRLRAQNLYPTEIKEGIATTKTKARDIRKYFRTDRVSLKSLAIMTRQMATLLGAGLPLVSVLQALSDQTDSDILQKIVIDIKEDVEEGSSLAKSLGRFPKTFPRLYVNMVAAGEASGTLDTVLLNLADHLEAQLSLRGKVQSALIYPALMLVVCTGVIIGLFIFVIPNIVEIFTKQGAQLPLPTRIVIAISNFLISYWGLLILLAVMAAVSAISYYRTERGRSVVDRLLLRLPIFGPLYVKICTARTALTLGALVHSGVGLLTALEITRKIMENVHFSKALADAQEGVREGRSLAKELRKSGIYPIMLSHMIAVGETGGALESMLQKAGAAYESEVDATLNGLTSLLEPLMTMFVGGIVFCIVISVLLPMADLIDVIQR